MRWKRAFVVAILAVAVLFVTAWVIVATYDYNKLRPQIEGAFKEATGRGLKLRGNLGLKIGFTPTLVVNGAAVQNAPWGSRPDMAEIRRFEIQLALIPLVFRHVAVKRIVLTSPDILVETSSAGESNLDFLGKIGAGSAKKEKPATGKVELTVNEIRIENGSLTYRNGKTGKAYVLDLSRFDASAGGADSPLKVTATGSYNGKTFDVKGNFVPLAGFTDPTTSWPFSLDLAIAGATVGVKGTIKDAANLRGIDAKVTVSSKDATRIGEFIGVSLPLQGPLDLSCRVTDSRPKIYEIHDFKLVAGGSDLGGALVLDLTKSRPALTADLSSKKLDLRTLAGKEKTSSKTEATRGRVFPDSPLPLEPLQLADATVSIRAAEVLAPKIVLHDLDAKAALLNGRLSVRPLTAVVGGGRLDGRFDLESRGKAAYLATVLTVRQLDVGAMLRELKQANILEGRMDARIDVSGTGTSIAGIMSGSSGTTYATMGEGRLNNKYLGLLGSNIASGIIQMINPFKKETPFTRLSCLVCGFKIGKGNAETTAFVVNSDYMSVVGNGTINLRTEGLDFNLTPIPKEGIGTGLTGKLNLSLGELTRPFKLAGTLAHPSLAIDVTQSAIAAGKAVGGFMLFGPAGLGSALVGSSSDDKQLCPLAIKAAQQGVKLNLAKKGVAGKAAEGVEKGIGAIEKGLKGIFGK